MATAASLGFKMDQQMVEQQLRQAEEHLQRCKDQDGEIVRLTRTLEITNGTVSWLRAQLDDIRKSRDDWREQARTAQSLLAEQVAAKVEAKAKTEASNEAAT